MPEPKLSCAFLAGQLMRNEGEVLTVAKVIQEGESLDIA